MYAKVDCYKGDFDGHNYPLKNCEITLYKRVNGVYTIAKDLNGNDCVGMTNNNGRCAFMVTDTDFDSGGTIQYYAEETTAPFGYKRLPGKYPVRPAPTQNDPIVTRMGLLMFDKIIIIPPKTGGYDEALLNPYTGNPIALIWWLSRGAGSSEYFDKIIWTYGYDSTGHAVTDTGSYLPGHIEHPNPSASVLVTDVALTWVDERDNVTRSVPAGGNIPMQYIDIFNV